MNKVMMMGEELNELKNQRQDTNLVIKIGSKEIHVHRDVVTEKSDYFKAMLSHDTREKQSGVVEMKDVEFDSVKACIDHMYGKEISIGKENSECLMHVASIMQLASVCDEIVQFLQRIVDVKSVFMVRRIAVLYHVKSLVEKCHRITLKNLASLVEEEELYEVDKDYLLMLLVSKQSIHPRFEDSKLAIILRWINSDFRNRKTELGELLQVINLLRVSKSYLKYILQNEKVVPENPDFKEKLTMLLVDSSDIAPEPAKICFVPNPNSLLYLDFLSKSLQVYHPAQNSSTKFGPYLPQPFTGKPVRVVATEDFVSLYMIGYWKKLYNVNMSEEEPRWVERQHMIELHELSSDAALHGDHIYVDGKFNTERYTISENKWTEVSHSGFLGSVVRRALAICCGFLYCFGQNLSSERMPVVEVRRLSLDRLEWSAFEQINLKILFASVVYGQCIYVAGGADELAEDMTVECYNHTTGSWTHLTKFTQLGFGYRSIFCLLNRRLYFLGVRRIDSYDLEHDVWSTHSRRIDSGIRGCVASAVFAPLSENCIVWQDDTQADAKDNSSQSVAAQHHKKCVML